MDPTRTPSALLDQLVTSTNAHDLDALVDCFAVDYEHTDPAHPVRSFTGAAQVHKNWAALFAAVPDIHLDVQQRVLSGESFWLEGRQVGTRRDGQPMDNQMVFIAHVSGGRIASAHIYVTPVEQAGPDIDAVIGGLTGAGAAGGGAS